LWKSSDHLLHQAPSQSIWNQAQNSHRNMQVSDYIFIQLKLTPCNIQSIKQGICILHHSLVCGDHVLHITSKLLLNNTKEHFLKKSSMWCTKTTYGPGADPGFDHRGDDEDNNHTRGIRWKRYIKC
jgi:hypothetical protein